MLYTFTFIELKVRLLFPWESKASFEICAHLCVCACVCVHLCLCQYKCPTWPDCHAKGCVAVWTSGTGEDNPGPHCGQTCWIQCCGDECQVITLAHKTLVSYMLAFGWGALKLTWSSELLWLLVTLEGILVPENDGAASVVNHDGCVHEYMCLRERERVCDTERKCVCVWERERESVHVWENERVDISILLIIWIYHNR